MIYQLTHKQDQGPDPLDAPQAIILRHTAAKDGMVQVPRGFCHSWTFKTCVSVVCAIGDVDINMPDADITGRMWKPRQSYCTVNNRAGEWRDQESTVMVALRRTEEDSSALAPPDAVETAVAGPGGRWKVVRNLLASLVWASA